MILAIDKQGALYVFVSAEDAERGLEAIDVQNDAFEFCDARGQRYIPAYTSLPSRSRFGIVDIGAFRLIAQGDIDWELPERFMERAQHLEHTSFPFITSIEALRQLRDR